MRIEKAEEKEEERRGEEGRGVFQGEGRLQDNQASNERHQGRIDFFLHQNNIPRPGHIRSFLLLFLDILHSFSVPPAGISQPQTKLFFQANYDPDIPRSNQKPITIDPSPLTCSLFLIY